MNRGTLLLLLLLHVCYISLVFAQEPITYTNPIVLGQTDLQSVRPGNPISATNLNTPTSVSYLQNQLFVCDSNNARLLIYPESSFVTGGAATVAPTNPDLVSSGSYLTRQVRAFSYFTDQFVWLSSDPGQRRVSFELYKDPFSFDQTPSQTIPSDLYSSIVGTAITDSSTGDIYTVDVYYNRILRFPFYNTTFPSAIYGQPDISSTQPNRFSSNGDPDSNTLYNPSSATLGCNGDLWVSDTMNNRILHFSRGSTTADIVIGQQNFTTRDASTPGGTATSLNSPGGIALNEDCTLLFVADSGNNRILRYHYPFSTGLAAEAQLEGSDFGALFNPLDIAIDNDRSMLWIADSFKNRVIGVVTSFIPSNSSSSTPSPFTAPSSSASPSAATPSPSPVIGPPSFTPAPASPSSISLNSQSLTASPSTGAVNSASRSPTTPSSSPAMASPSSTSNPIRNSMTLSASTPVSNSDSISASASPPSTTDGDNNTTGKASRLSGFLNYLL